MSRVSYLTGIKPTGKIHLGNYFAVMKPVIDILENNENTDVYFFVADYHALTSHPDPKELQHNIQEIMVTLTTIFENVRKKDTNNLYLYRQSKIPEIFEYFWIFSCYTAKGFLNRNHSYKSLVDGNISNNKDPDKGIFSGVFDYPVLQAADIYVINPDYVPIGKDQKQHIEIANEIVGKINYVYNKEVFKPIIPVINDKEVLPGIDGMKMSKSYGNTIDIICDTEDLKKYIYKIKTNSKGDGETKYPDESILSTIAKIIGDQDWYNYFIIAMQNGKGWKELKDILYDKLRKEVLDYHVQYNYYSRNPNIATAMFVIHESRIQKIVEKRLYKLKKIIGI